MTISPAATAARARVTWASYPPCRQNTVCPPGQGQTPTAPRQNYSAPAARSARQESLRIAPPVVRQRPSSSAPGYSAPRQSAPSYSAPRQSAPAPRSGGGGNSGGNHGNHGR